MDLDPFPIAIIIQTAASLQWFYLFFFILLLLCSALISGAEVALFSLSPTDFDPLNKQFSQQDTVRKLLDRPKKLLATILIANNTVNITSVLIFGLLTEEWLSVIESEQLRFLLEVVLATFLLLLFGEIFPKVYASRNSVTFANFMAVPLKVLDFLFSPLSLPMRSVTNLIQDKLGSKKTNFTISHLSQALELTNESDTTTDEQQILQGIVSFGNTDTKNVMRNRMDVFALDEQTEFKEVIRLVIENGYSRIPVYKDSIDHIQGVLYVKDLLPYKDRKNFEWTKLLRDTYFVPENKKLDDLLDEFQEQKKHLAIVVDEYGGTSGLITMEDIIEEIVGDISDEFDDEDLIYSKLDDNTYIFEGKTPLKDFYRITGLEDYITTMFEEAKGESETIAGFLLEQTGSFPRKNDKIVFSQVTFFIEVMDRKRIKQVKCKLS